MHSYHPAVIPKNWFFYCAQWKYSNFRGFAGHTWFTYFHFFNLKFLESCLTPIFNLQSNDWLRIKIFQRIQKNHSGEKLSSETKRTYFFDNFTSFRFHFSPNLLASVLFTKLSIFNDKLFEWKTSSNWRNANQMQTELNSEQWEECF